MNNDGKQMQKLVIPGAEHLPPEIRERLYSWCVTIGFWRAVYTVLPTLNEEQRERVLAQKAGVTDMEFMQWLVQVVPNFGETCKAAILDTAKEMAQ